MVVNGDRQLLLGALLADYVLVEELLDFQRLGNFVGAASGRLGLVILQNRVANSDAFVADVRTRIVAGRGNQLADYVLALVAK
jgi:hypothetical protein